MTWAVGVTEEWGWAWRSPRGCGSGWDAGGLRRLALQEADTDDQQGTLGFEEFCAFYKMMSTRRDLYLLMLTYSTHKGPLDAADLQRFLQVEQKVRQPQGQGPHRQGLGSVTLAAEPVGSGKGAQPGIRGPQVRLCCGSASVPVMGCHASTVQGCPTGPPVGGEAGALSSERGSAPTSGTPSFQRGAHT